MSHSTYRTVEEPESSENRGFNLLCAFRSEGALRSEMLSEFDIAFFNRRIEEVLHEGSPTEWQRQFLSDVGGKISRYGARTKLTDKQLAILRRLTQEITKPPGLATVPEQTARSAQTSAPSKSRSRAQPFKRGLLRRNPVRFRNPLRPPRAIQRVASWGKFSGIGGRGASSVLALFIILGFIGSFLGGTPTTDDRPPSPTSAAVDNAAKIPSARKTRITITDGDTIRLTDGTRVRLVGFNTPEKFEPQCLAEAALGNRASARLKQLVAAARTTEVTLVRCACEPGTEGTKKCNYGRSCGTLAVDGRDVGQTLIAEGLAVPFTCGATGCPPTPRPWCG